MSNTYTAANWSLDEDNLAVTCGSRSIRLLPKEFALLAFLHRNSGRVFTRDQLLDAVWANEAPIDRTVDDHVYRLRKKLRSLQAEDGSTIAIDTVRSKGYRLIVSPPSENAETSASHAHINPMLHSTEYQEQIRNMFDQYVLYGHGAALQTLAAQPEVFGVDADRELHLRAQFQVGNFRDVVESSYPFQMKVFWMLSLYRSLHPNNRALQYLKRAVDSYLLPAQRQMEVQCFHMPSLHLQLGNMEQAQQLIADAVMMTEAMDLEGYRPAIRMLEVMSALYERRLEDARTGLDLVGELLVQYPWQREAAHHQIAEGLYLLMTTDKVEGRRMVEGRRLVESGIDRLEQIGIPGHLIIRVQDGLHFVTHIAPDRPLQRALKARWKALADRYEFASIARTIEFEFAQHAL